VEFDGFDLSLRGATGPAILDAVERDFWLDLWRAPVLDAVAEQGIETRWYGPLQATVVAALPETPMLNLLLGAAEPDAVGEGHLAQALEWVDSLGVDCRLPAIPSSTRSHLMLVGGPSADEEEAGSAGVALGERPRRTRVSRPREI
jgi:hypothetical protein